MGLGDVDGWRVSILLLYEYYIATAAASKGQTICAVFLYTLQNIILLEYKDIKKFFFQIHDTPIYFLCGRFIRTLTCPPDFQNGRTGGASFANQYFQQPNVIPGLHNYSLILYFHLSIMLMCCRQNRSPKSTTTLYDSVYVYIDIL